MLVLAEHSRQLAVVLLWPTHGIVCAVLSDIKCGYSIQGPHNSGVYVQTIKFPWLYHHTQRIKKQKMINPFAVCSFQQIKHTTHNRNE